MKQILDWRMDPDDPATIALIKRCERAFTRRFGASTLPLKVKILSSGRIRIRDNENGAWAIYDVGGYRIKRFSESEATL